MLYASFWAVRLVRENLISCLLALSGIIPVARVFPLVLTVTANDPASPLLDKVIGSAPAIWIYVTGTSTIMLARLVVSSARYGRMAGAQRKASRGEDEVDGVRKLPPGGTTDWFAM